MQATVKTTDRRPETVGPQSGSLGGRRRPVSLGDYFDLNRQPSVASVFRRAPFDSAKSNAGDHVEPLGDDRCRKLYIHWRSTTTTIVVAERLHLDVADGGTINRRPSSSHLTSTGSLHSVPVDHSGWYELMSADGHATAPIATVRRLMALGVERFLVRQPIVANFVSGSTSNGVLTNRNSTHQRSTVQIALGETLTFLRRDRDDLRSARRGSDQPTSTVRCFVDRTGNEVELFVDQRGAFMPVAGLNSVSGVHRIGNIIGKFRLPVIVRLVCSGGRDSYSSNDISAGSVLRLLSVGVEPAVHLVPLPTASAATASSFNRVLVVPKRASVFVEQSTDDCSERRQCPTPFPGADILPQTIVDELSRHCERLIACSRSVPVICRLLAVTSHSTDKVTDEQVSHSHGVSALDNSTEIQQKNVTNLGRQPSVDSGTSSLTQQPSMSTAGEVFVTTGSGSVVENKSTKDDAVESHLMEEIDFIYDAIRGGVDPSLHHRQHVTIRQPAVCSARNHHQVSADFTSKASGCRPEVEIDTIRTKTSTTSCFVNSQRSNNGPHKSIILDTNFVIASSRQLPEKQLTLTATVTKMGDTEEKRLSNGGAIPMVGRSYQVTSEQHQQEPPISVEQVGNNNTFSASDDQTSINGNRKCDPIECKDDAKQSQTGCNPPATSNRIYDSIVLAAEVSQTAVDDVKITNQIQRHHQGIRPQSFAGTSTAVLADVPNPTMTIGNRWWENPMKQIPSDDQNRLVPPPLPPPRQTPPMFRSHIQSPPNSSRSQPVRYADNSLPLKSASPFGGVVGALSRSFLSTVRRVGGARSGNSKTLVLNRSNSGNSSFDRQPSPETDGTGEPAPEENAAAVNKSLNKWWNIDDQRNIHDRSSDQFVISQASTHKTLTITANGGKQRFSYAEPGSRDYNARYFVKQL